MPSLKQHYTAIVRAAHPNEHSLPIRLVGARHNGILPHGNAAAQVPRRRDRLFH